MKSQQTRYGHTWNPDVPEYHNVKDRYHALLQYTRKQKTSTKSSLIEKIERAFNRRQKLKNKNSL